MPEIRQPARGTRSPYNRDPVDVVMSSSYAASCDSTLSQPRAAAEELDEIADVNFCENLPVDYFVLEPKWH